MSMRRAANACGLGIVRWVFVLCLALVAVALAAGDAHAQLITEFSAGIPPAPSPRGIVLGPDGNIWFTEQTGNRIGRITPAGVVTEFSAGLSPGANPGGMALGPDNNVWFVERTGNRIGRIIAIPANGTVGTITEFGAGISPGAGLITVVAGSDGNLWFTENTGNRIGRITTAGVVTEFSAGISAGALPNNIALGPDGNLWFTEQSDRIAKITTAGVVTEFSAGLTAGGAPSGLAAGPDGNLWFTEINGNRVGKITTAGVVTEYSAGISPGSSPRNISLGPDNNLWFTETTGNRIGRVTTVGVITEFGGGISPGSQPWNVVAGSDGNLWFTEFSGSQIGQITTAGVVLNEFSAGITFGAGPAGIVTGPDGNLWFAEYGVDAIGQITPAGVVTQFSAGITPGAGPAFIAVGPDGNLWFTENNLPQIGRITPTGVVTEFSVGITPAANLQGIAAGPDGNMWFAECDGNRIGRIIALPANGTVGTITEFAQGFSLSSCPTGIFKGPDDNLWFTEYDGNRVGRIVAIPANGTVGTVSEFSAGISANSGPNDITAGPDGNMWFTEYDGHRIGKIIALPANGIVGTVTEFPTGNGRGAEPNYITAGPDGNLWFTTDRGNNILRITPAGVLSFYGQAPTTGSVPFGITAGPDGNMWFTELLGARIGRFLMPTSNYVVTNNTDNVAAGSGSLRDAINRSNADPDPNTITFDPAVTGTITLINGLLPIAGATTINGPGAGVLTIDGNAANRIFSVFELSSPACPALSGPVDYLVTISGLTLTNAQRHTDNSGGAIVSGHSLVLDNVIIQNSIAPRGGGLSFLTQYPGQSLTITNSQFLNNIATPLVATVSNSLGGGLKIGENCANTRTFPVPVTISNSLFSGNHVQPIALSGFGGAIDFSSSAADISISDTSIEGNHVDAPNPPVAGQVYQGGGIRGSGKSLTITRTEFSGNSVTDVTGADVTRGGAAHLYNSDPNLQGAADIFNVSIVNSTISGNTTPSTSGALLIFGNVAATIDNSTIANNSAVPTRTGGVLMSTGATSPPSAGNATAPTLTLASTILAKNLGSDLSDNLATMPTFTVNATNSAIQNICPSPTCEITVSGSGNLIAVDPMLGPLANNGGPTLTHALLAGSPAINAGSNPLGLATDQRGTGFPRTFGAATDMGAYESNVVGPPPPVLQSAKSRRVHGAAGTFDLPLSLVVPPAINHSPTTEPRQGPAFTIVFTFDKPITGATATVTESAAVAGTLTFSGNDVIVPLTAVPNQQYVTVSLTNVASLDGGTGGVGSARIGFLLGDVNGSRVVSIADLGLVNAQLAQPVNASNYLKDVNVTGTLTLADKGITNTQLTKNLPAP
jgi:streptogramin lyase